MTDKRIVGIAPCEEEEEENTWEVKVRFVGDLTAKIGKQLTFAKAEKLYNEVQKQLETGKSQWIEVEYKDEGRRIELFNKNQILSLELC